MDLSEITYNKNRHPWELSRTEKIIGVCGRYNVHGKILDVGCGDHYFDECLINSNQGVDELYGIDIFSDENIVDGKCHYYNNYNDIEGIKFDCILMMDVLEHIENDGDFLKNILEFAAPNSLLIITVPALQKLFSEHDKVLKHYRRYNYKTLMNLLKMIDVDVINMSYFYASLVLPRLLSKHKPQTIGGWKYSENNYVTKIIKHVLNADFHICVLLSSIGIHLPGLSLLAVCRIK